MTFKRTNYLIVCNPCLNSNTCGIITTTYDDNGADAAKSTTVEVECGQQTISDPVSQPMPEPNSQVDFIRSLPPIPISTQTSSISTLIAIPESAPPMVTLKVCLTDRMCHIFTFDIGSHSIS